MTLKNGSGEISDSFQVYITGLPGPPEGPLEVPSVNRHSCSLAWKPPKHTGGLPVTHYVVERSDISGNAWITIASQCRDTQYTVQGLTLGQEYLFRVHAANENGMGPALQGANPIKARAPFDPPSPPGAPKITEVGGDFVHLEWDKPESDGGARIQGELHKEQFLFFDFIYNNIHYISCIGYWIDKREVGSNSWQRVNAALCVATQITCSNLIEGRQYEFRIFAQNEAGLSEPSSNSTQVKVVDPKGNF